MSSTKWLAVCSSLFNFLLTYFGGRCRHLGIRLRIIWRTKQCYCDVIPMSCYVVNGFFLPTCNHKWEVFVCLIYTKRDEEKDLYKSIVWPFHSQDLRCHDGRVIPYQCLNLYYFFFPFKTVFILWIISFHLSWRLKRYLFIPPPSLLLMLFSVFRKKFKWYKEIFFQCI